MAEHQLDTEVGSIRDSMALELTFKTIWEGLRKTAELVEHLREDRNTLRENVRVLTEQLSSLQEELRKKEENLQKLREERNLKEEHLAASLRNNSSFTDDEKEALKARIKELLAKINSHL